MSALESYRVDIRPILEDFGADIPLSAAIELGRIDVGDESFVPLGPAHLEAHLTSAGAGIVLDGTLQVTVQAVCSRCLREFPLDVTTEVEGFYVEPGREAELPEEQEFAYVIEDSVDIADAIVTSLALDLPFAPLHAEDCPGICPRCGADLVEGPCSCGPDLSASPFALLAEMFPDEPEK